MGAALDYVDYLRANAERERYRALVFKSNEGKFKQRMYKNHERIKEQLINIDELTETDIYISLNTFVKHRRLTENICQLENLYIDLDCYKMGLSKEAALYFLKQDHFNRTIPRPNRIIDSGKGLYLIWSIRPVPIKALPLWSALERYFYEVLKDLGADAKCLDATRFLRVPGSINSSNGNLVHVLNEYDYNYRYEIGEIKKEYLKIIQDNKNKYAKRNKTVNKTLRFYNAYTLNLARIDDLKKLCELRGYDLEGYRENILFLYRYWTCIVEEDSEKALDDVIELNKSFNKPLKTVEVINHTKSAETHYKAHKYNYSNSKLIEMLDITHEEEKNLNTIISKKEKYRRNNEKRKILRRDEKGMTPKQKEISNLIKNIKDLKEIGMTQHNISKELKVSIRTVKTYWIKNTYM